MPPFSAEVRREKQIEAVSLAAKGRNYTQIATAMEIDWRTAKKLVQDEYASRSEHRNNDKEAAIATYTELIREGWDRLETLDARSLNVSGILNSIRQSQERIDKLTGAEAPIKLQDVDEEYDVVWDDADSLTASS